MMIVSASRIEDSETVKRRTFEFGQPSLYITLSARNIVLANWFKMRI